MWASICSLPQVTENFWFLYAYTRTQTNKQIPVNLGFKLVVLSYMSQVCQSLGSAVTSKIYHSGSQNLHEVCAVYCHTEHCSCQLSQDALVDAGFLCMLGEIKERPYTSCKLLDLFSLPTRLVNKPTDHVLDKSDSCKRSLVLLVF